MRLRFLLSIVAAPLLIATMAKADAAAQAGASAPGGQDCAPALSFVPAPPALCAATVPAPQLLPLEPTPPQGTYALCGSCSGSCVGIPVNSNCIYRGGQTGRCQLNGSCGSGLGLWCQCIVGPPP